MLDINTIATAALTLSDGTPVTFNKVTSKGNIQVRLPDSHAFTNGDPLKIFRPDGTHYKNATDLTLVANTAPVAVAADPAPVAAAQTSATYEVDGDFFEDLDDAKQEATDIFQSTGVTTSIYVTERRLVGTVGFVAA